MLSSQKHLFSLKSGLHYLNCATMSPLLQSVQQVGIAGLLLKSTPYLITQDSYFEGVDQLKTLFAKLVNGPAERIAIIPSVSYGMATVAKNLNAKPGQHILLLENEFPSDVYSWEEVCQTKQLTIKTIFPTGTERGKSWNEAILEAISPETALLVLGPVHWTDGTRFDAEAIGKRCRETGTLLALDGTQCIGAFPLDLKKIQPDALIVAGYKWLMGSYGLGLAYFGPAFDQGRPLEENWINRKGSTNFRMLMDYTTEYRPDASRYSMGEQSNFIQVPMLAAAIEQLLTWTPTAIQTYCHALIQPELAKWQALGFWIEDEAYRASHLFGLKHEQLNMDRLRNELQKRNVYISIRGTTLRISPHVYNDSDDMAALTEALKASL
ncbi:MAG: aminotransferase class V-fold PLP-dependent enzyme [Siphonobacter sp.]